MSEKNILIAFTGHINHEVTSTLLKNIKSKLNLLEVNPTVNKRVYSVLVESIENMSRHSSENDRAILLLGKSESAYTVIAGNHISNSDISGLEEKLMKISNLGRLELKQMYSEQLMSKRTDSNKAGLGILEIAIKSENNIKYEFRPLDAERSFYLLQIEVAIQ